MKFKSTNVLYILDARKKEREVAKIIKTELEKQFAVPSQVPDYTLINTELRAYIEEYAKNPTFKQELEELLGTKDTTTHLLNPLKLRQYLNHYYAVERMGVTNYDLAQHIKVAKEGTSAYHTDHSGREKGSSKWTEHKWKRIIPSVLVIGSAAVAIAT
jgi:hypothetical protein